MLTPEQRVVAEAIYSAPDVQLSKTEEAITEPHAPPGTKRTTAEDRSSATVHPGTTFRVSYLYLYGPDSPSWGALSGIDENLV